MGVLFFISFAQAATLQEYTEPSGPATGLLSSAAIEWQMAMASEHSGVMTIGVNFIASWNSDGASAADACSACSCVQSPRLKYASEGSKQSSSFRGLKLIDFANSSFACSKFSRQCCADARL